jgi:hypothetical protein
MKPAIASNKTNHQIADDLVMKKGSLLLALLVVGTSACAAADSLTRVAEAKPMHSPKILYLPTTNSNKSSSYIKTYNKSSTTKENNKSNFSKYPYINPAILNLKSDKSSPKSKTDSKSTPSKYHLINPAALKSTIKIKPYMMQQTRVQGFSSESVEALKQLGAKAKSGNASNDEMAQLKEFCNIAADMSSNNQGGFNRDRKNEGSFNRDGTRNNTGTYDADRSRRKENTWDITKNSSGKGGGGLKVDILKLQFGGSGSGSKTSSSTNKGTAKDSRTNTRNETWDQNSTQNNNANSKNEQNNNANWNNTQTDIAKQECDSVVALLGTKDTNKTNLEIKEMELADREKQREHEEKLARRLAEQQQTDSYVQMGAGLLNSLLGGLGQNSSQPSSAASDAAELKEVIRKQQEQIDMLMQQSVGQ